jgi:hypothetical protein
MEFFQKWRDQENRCLKKSSGADVPAVTVEIVPFRMSRTI